MEYVKACLELSPFDQTNGTLCPRDFRSSSLMTPIELMVEPDKSKLFRDCIVPMVQALKDAIRTIQNSCYSTNCFYYNVLKKDCRSEPKDKDLCMVMKKGLGKNYRFGVIVEVNKCSVWVKFPDGKTQKFANDSVVILMRPPKERVQELDETNSN